MMSTNLKVEVSNKQILSIALPITITILIPQINMLTNSIFLGQLSEEALGNAGITGVFYLIFAVMGHGLNNAMQSVFSRCAGSGNTQAFKVILSQGVRLSLKLSVFGILFTWLIAPYILKLVSNDTAYPQEIDFLKIRIAGLPFLFLFQMANAFLVSTLNSRYLMIGVIVEASLNIILDFLLIKGRYGFPGMGFNGAAIASVIAEAAGMITVYLVLLKTGLKSRYSLLKNFSFHKYYSSQISKVALPLVGQYVISVTTWLIFFFLIESRNDPAAKAISNIMRNVFGLTGVFVWAFAATTNTMVSNLIGQKKEEQVLEVIYKIMRWSVGFCCLLILCLNIFPVSFLKLFDGDKTFIQTGLPVIRVVSAGLMCMSIANIWLNALTGTGKTKINLRIELIAITLYLGYTIFFMRMNYLSLAMAWSNELIYWFTIFILSFLYMKSNKWKSG